MLLWSPAADEQVVHRDKTVVVALQHLVHEVLECLAWVSQPKWHADELPVSHSPKGVMTAVFGTSRGLTGIYLVKPLCSSSLEKMVHPYSLAVRLAMLGTNCHSTSKKHGSFILHTVYYQKMKKSVISFEKVLHISMFVKNKNLRSVLVALSVLVARVGLGSS